MKKQNLKESGITLIALIITIIVLLILAGVAISAVVGDNGILNQATKAADLTEEEKTLEQINLAISAYEAGKYAKTETRTLSEYLKTELELDAIRETKYGTLIFKVGSKIVSVYNDGTEIKDYHENTLANNAQILKVSQESADITAEDGFLTDNGIARKYVKNITFNTTNTIPNSYDISWDVSEIRDETVMAYATGDETNGYDITIVADGEIYLPENSTSLFQFCGYNENLPEYEIDLTGLNSSTAKNMDNLFCDFGYYSMTNFYVGDNFDTSNAINMEGMFGRCGYMKMVNLDLGKNFNTSNVTNMVSMFLKCGYMCMTNLDLENQFNTSNVTTMNGMFDRCGYTSMISLDLGTNFNTINVEDFSWMFRECGYISMINLNLGNKFNTSNATFIEYVFYNCGNKNLKKLYFGKSFNGFTNINNIPRLLNGCGTSTCKYYVSSETAKNWLLNLDSSLRRTENWNSDYIIVKEN